MVNKKSILLDVDDVIVDNAFLDAANNFNNTKYTEKDFSGYYIDKEMFNEETLPKYYEFLLHYNMYSNCRLIEGVEEILPILAKENDIYICSSCVLKGLERKSGIFFMNKFNFLVEKFPFLIAEHIIFTGDKNRFSDFDYQIDDLLTNLKNKIPNKLLFTRYHNKEISKEELDKENVKRVDNWQEIYEYITSKK